MRRCLFLALWVVAARACTSASTSSDREDDTREGRCTGCRDQKHADTLFDVLAYSVKHNDRMSYLALDMGWLDRLLDDGAKVHIAFNEFSKVNLETATLLSDELHHQSLSFFHDKSEYKDLKPKYYDAKGCKLGTDCMGGGKNDTDAEPQPAAAGAKKVATATAAAAAAGKTATTTGGDSSKKGEEEKGGEKGEKRREFRVRRRRSLAAVSPAASKSAPKSGTSNGGDGGEGSDTRASTGSTGSSGSSGGPKGMVSGKPSTKKVLSPLDEEFQVRVPYLDLYLDLYLGPYPAPIY